MEKPVDKVLQTTRVKEQGAEVVKPPWSSEALLALAEEMSNYGAHIPVYGEVEKKWKDML